MRAWMKVLATTLVVLVAVSAFAYKYLDYLMNPWTRDGQVRANVIEVAPRVSGPIVALPIVDNQSVKAGDLLFQIDPRTFQQAVNEAEARYDSMVDELASLDSQIDAAQASIAQAQAQVTQAEAQVRSTQADFVRADEELRRYSALVTDGFTSRSNYDTARRNHDVAAASRDRAEAALLQSRSALSQAEAQLATVQAKRGERGDNNAQLRAARASLENARLNLQFTEQRASVDGFVTNLSLRLGSQAIANRPAMALVDRHSFWVDAYFRESVVGRLQPGDAAFVTLMSYSGVLVPARVQSIAWGIAQQDGSTGTNLLPTVAPSFEWIRLAQRIPVRIEFGALPQGIALRVGMTASVLVRSGTHRAGALPPPAPSLLQ